MPYEPWPRNRGPGSFGRIPAGAAVALLGLPVVLPEGGQEAQVPLYRSAVDQFTDAAPLAGPRRAISNVITFVPELPSVTDESTISTPASSLKMVASAVLSSMTPTPLGDESTTENPSCPSVRILAPS